MRDYQSLQAQIEAVLAEVTERASQRLLEIHQQDFSEYVNGARQLAEAGAARVIPPSRFPPLSFEAWIRALLDGSLTPSRRSLI